MMDGERITTLFSEELIAEVPSWEANAAVPRSVFERLADTGAFAARWSPPEHGGDIDVAIALARACGLLGSAGAGIAIMSHVEGFVGLSHRSAFGQRHREEIDGGRRIGCIAISEATGGSDVTNCETTAEPTRDGWRIDGHKHFVSNFRTASDCVVFARTARNGRFDDYTLFVVPSTADGLEATPHALIGARASGTVQIDLDDVEIDNSRCVGEVGTGLRQVMEFLRLERLWAAIGSAVCAELCLEMAIAWSDRRRVGGTALRGHQAIAHRLADLASIVRSAQALVREVVARARERQLTSATAALAKLYTSQVAWRAADEAVQLLGGRGYTEATPLARIWLDARLMRIGGGTDEVLRELVARAQRPGPLRDHPAVAAVAHAAVEDDEGTRRTDRDDG